MEKGDRKKGKYFKIKLVSSNYIYLYAEFHSFQILIYIIVLFSKNCKTEKKHRESKLQRDQNHCAGKINK